MSITGIGNVAFQSSTNSARIYGGTYSLPNGGVNYYPLNFAVTSGYNLAISIYLNVFAERQTGTIAENWNVVYNSTYGANTNATWTYRGGGTRWSAGNQIISSGIETSGANLRFWAGTGGATYCWVTYDAVVHCTDWSKITVTLN